jgi:hypothetical protein
MHPESARILAGQRQAELAGAARRARAGRRGGTAPAAPRLLAPRSRPLPRLAPTGAQGGIFLAEPEAFGFRTYLTPAEARTLASKGADLIAPFAGRLGDPRSRPPGALPFEIVVLHRQIPGGAVL